MDVTSSAFNAAVALERAFPASAVAVVAAMGAVKPATDDSAEEEAIVKGSGGGGGGGPEGGAGVEAASESSSGIALRGVRTAS